MIKINVLRSMADQKIYDAMQKAISDFESSRERKSFAERHPELGKMINCPVCQRRHRNARACVPQYSRTMKDADGVEQPYPGTKNEHGTDLGRVALGWGHGSGRILKHRNKRSLRVLERATKIYREEKIYFPNIDEKEDDKLGKRCLSRALNEIRKERALRRHRLLKITNRSRRINRAV